MNTISINYQLKWQLKSTTHYKWSTCGQLFNCRTKKIIKKTINNGSIGYWINHKFYTLDKLRFNIELIPKQICPF